MDNKKWTRTEFKKEKFAELIRREQETGSIRELSVRTGISPVTLYRHLHVEESHQPYFSSVMKLALNSLAGISLEEYMDATGYAYVEDGPRSEKECAVFDHKGNAFVSQRAMCRHYYVHPATYFRRIKLGWTVEQALTYEAHSRHNTVYDHEGTRYNSLTDMSRAYGLPKQKLSKRLKAGWPLKDALTRPSNTTLRDFKPSITDHEGNTFKSYKDMCSYWNVSHATFYRRICAGRSIEKALAPTGRMGGNAVRDHKGKEYRTQTEMCKAYGISKQTYSRRVIAGYTVEEALTIPLDRKRSIDQTLRRMHKPSSSASGELARTGKLVQDHKGNEYASIKDLAQAYDIAPNLIYAAIHRGKTPAKAVSDELEARKKMTAPDGKVYGSMSEMAAAYGVSPANFRARLKSGYTIKEALLLPPNPTKIEKDRMRSRQINKEK